MKHFKYGLSFSAEYESNELSAGRVTKYLAAIREPPLATGETKLEQEQTRLFVASLDLPEDARTVKESEGTDSWCEDWQSKTLSFLVGKAYAQGWTETGVPDVTMEAVSRPSC